MPFSGALTLATVVAGIGALVVLILAVVQEGKVGARGTAVKSGFFAAVSLVLLSIAVAATVFVVYLGLSAWVFTKAPYTGNVNTIRAIPPVPLATVVSKPGVDGATVSTTPYVRLCTTSCDFTPEEITSIRAWATEYKAWIMQTNVPADPLAAAKRRDLVNALSFLLISAPLFFVFFRFVRRPSEKGPGVVRSVYFYYVAFAGLVLAVVSAAVLLNVALKAIAGVSDSSTSPVPQPLSTDDANVQLAQSVARCGTTCGFTAEEVALAQRWPDDYRKNIGYNLDANTSKTQGDLASNIPLLAVGIPLFWYHFASIRRDGTEGASKSGKRRARRKT